MVRAYLLFSSAGEYRQVNVSKDDFPFATAREIPRLMAELERGPLRQYTPCRFESDDEVVKALATVHTELMLIHPFREGNGRAGRLLAIVMGLQAKLPPLDFSDIKGKKRLEYLRAVRSGLDRDYEPMERVFNDVVRKTRRVALYERDLAGIQGELGWQWKSDLHAFYGSRRAHRRVKKFLPLLGVYQIRIGFDKRITHLFK